MHLVIEHVKCETELCLALVYNSKCRQYRFAQGYYGIQSLVHVDSLKGSLQRNVYIQQISINAVLKRTMETMITPQQCLIVV